MEFGRFGRFLRVFWTVTKFNNKQNKHKNNIIKNNNNKQYIYI